MCIVFSGFRVVVSVCCLWYVLGWVWVLSFCIYDGFDFCFIWLGCFVFGFFVFFSVCLWAFFWSVGFFLF